MKKLSPVQLEAPSTYKSLSTTELTYTPTGTTQTIPLGDANLTTLNLGSTTGNLALTLTVPSAPASGRIWIVNHATTPRSVTITLSSGTLKYAGTVNLASDAASSERIFAWTWNGSKLAVSPTDVLT